MRLIHRAACLAAVCVASIQVALAAPVQYVATLRGANTAPPNGSTGTGFFTLQLDVEAHTLEISGAFNLTATSTAAHLHCCAAPGANAMIAIGTPSLSGFPTSVVAGVYANTLNTSLSSTYSPSFIGGGSPAMAEATFAAGMAGGLVYLDIHSVNFPGGEIRAQVLPARVFGSGFEG